MTAAATETACSLRLSSAGATLQSFSQPGAGCSVSESTVQHLLASMRQTAEAAKQIRRQRDALSQPRQQQQQQQQPGVSEPRSPASAALNRLLSESVRSNQLQQLASLLTTSGTPAAAAQQVSEVPPDSPAVPDRQLRHITSRADSSTLEAADTLLDLEFAARDAGSFTQHRAQLATMLARAAAEQQNHQDAGASLQLASPRAVKEEAAAAALVLGAPRRGSSAEPSASAPVAGTAGVAAAAAAPQSDASCGAAASAPAAAAGSDSSAARQRLQHELLALLSRHVAGLPQAGADQNGRTQVPGSAHVSVPGAGADATHPAAGATTAAATAAAHLTCSGPEPNECPAPSDDVPIFSVLQRVQQHLLTKQQGTAAAAAGRSVRSESSGFLHRLLQASQRLQDGADPDTLSRQLGEDQGLLLRTTSNLTSSTALPRPGLNAESVAAVSRAAVLAAAAEASRVQHVSLLQAQARSAEGPYPSYLDADLLTLFHEFKATRQQVRMRSQQSTLHLPCVRWPQGSCKSSSDSLLGRRVSATCAPAHHRHEHPPRQAATCRPTCCLSWLRCFPHRVQVAAILREAVEQGVMDTGLIHRLQQLRHRVMDSPSFTLPATAATEGAPAASAATAPSAAAPSCLASKRSRDQQRGLDAGGAAADAAEADAPSSKLRRTETMTSGGTATPPPAAAGAEAEPMDVSAPFDSSAGASGTRKAAPAEAAEPRAAAAGTDAPESPAAAAAAAPSDAAAPAGEGGLLAKSVECLVQVHRLTNRMLAKAVSAKKEGTEAARRAEELSALAATGHSTAQQLQLQVQMLQQQLQLAQLQLQARQQQLQQVHVRSQQAAVAYPQLVSQVAKSVSRLVTTASNCSLPVEHRKALAGIADELLHNCQC